MPQIILKLDITVKDYAEVAKNKAGFIGGFMSMFRIMDSVIESKIDSEIEKRIKEELGNTVASNVELELERAGVRCTVEYEYLSESDSGTLITPRGF